MPLYKYECANCEWTNEEFRSVKHRKLMRTACEKCNGIMVLQVALVAHTPGKWGDSARL